VTRDTPTGAREAEDAAPVDVAGEHSLLAGSDRRVSPAGMPLSGECHSLPLRVTGNIGGGRFP